MKEIVNKIQHQLYLLDMIEKLEEQVQQKLQGLRKERVLQCKNCNNQEKIKNISVIQTQWYTPPRGCTEGDYWNDGELAYYCSKCHIRNRLLFDRTKEEYEKYKENFNDWSGWNNKEKEHLFKIYYKNLFKEIIIDKNLSNRYKFVNNDMLDFEVL